MKNFDEVLAYVKKELDMHNKEIEKETARIFNKEKPNFNNLTYHYRFRVFFETFLKIDKRLNFDEWKKIAINQFQTNINDFAAYKNPTELNIEQFATIQAKALFVKELIGL